MANQITKDSTPDEVLVIAEQYYAVLQQTKLAFSKDKVLLDMKRRAAEAQNPPMTVEEWERMWATKMAAPAPEPEPVVPKAPRAKKAAVPKPEESARGAVIDPNYFWMSQENQAIGRTWIALRKQSNVVMNMLAVGPSGCGKTEGLRRLAGDNGLPFYKVDCASITTPDKWVGHKEVNEKGTYYVLSEHLRWLSADGFEPGIVVYDEITRLHPSLLNILIPILDGSQSIWVPDLGIYVNVHKDTVIAATANIGTGFSGTYGLDVALHDRFGVLLEQTFPPDADEIVILQRRTGINTESARMLVAIANQTRLKADNGELSKPVSTRALIDSAFWVSTGMSVTEASEATFVKKYSPDGKGSSERTIVRLILQGVAGGK
jgi:MoxR-like ATPase